MNLGFEYYRIDGQPAFASVLFTAIPANGDTVTINGDVFTYGTNFKAFNGTTNSCAESLAAAINADVSGMSNRLGVLTPAQIAALDPRRLYYAFFVGQTVFLVATNPGTTGNAYTLATSAAASMTVSGATFSGGTTGPLSNLAGATGTTAAWSEFVRTMTGSAITLSSTSRVARTAFIEAKSGNVANITHGPDSNCRHTLFTGQTYVIPVVPGVVSNLNAWYVNGTASDTVIVTYV